MAKELWTSGGGADWTAVLDRVSEALDACGKPKLPPLERCVSQGLARREIRLLISAGRSWFQEELPAAIASRPEQHLSKGELVKLVDWKLTRGKWRPRLLEYAEQQPEGVVEAASKLAFAALKEQGSDGVKEALKQLTKLKGVGPATASAALAAASSQVPFMSDEALEAVVGSREYTVKEFVALAEGVAGKQAELKELTGRDWSAREVEQALWAAAVLRRLEAGGEGAAGGGKPRSEKMGAVKKQATLAESRAGGRGKQGGVKKRGGAAELTPGASEVAVDGAAEGKRVKRKR